jgi:nitronate monooxygenase
MGARQSFSEEFVPLPRALQGRLAIPAIAAPMFLVSGPELVIETCRGGVLGTLPALNHRTSAGFEEWLSHIQLALSEDDAPFGVNLVVHATNPRFAEDLAICVEHRVPLVITALGVSRELVDRIHAYGGIVFHDVVSVRHAKAAIRAGVDGLILVSAGAGGHAGSVNPFALVPEIRRIFDGTLILAGCISDGRGIAAARMLGADLAYIGTRFIATKESLGEPGYKDMIIGADATDIVYTDRVSGINGNFLRPSIVAAGLDPDNLPERSDVDVRHELSHDRPKAWKQIWSAGQGVGSIDEVLPARELCRRLVGEYERAMHAFIDSAAAFAGDRRVHA